MIAVLHLPELTRLEDTPDHLVGAFAVVLPDDATPQQIGLRVSVRLPDTTEPREVGRALRAAAEAAKWGQR